MWGLGYHKIILAPLGYEHGHDVRERRVDNLFASGLEHRSYFCLHLVLRVVRRVEEPFPSETVAPPSVRVVSVRFRGEIVD